MQQVSTTHSQEAMLMHIHMIQIKTLLWAKWVKKKKDSMLKIVLKISKKFNKDPHMDLLSSNAHIKCSGLSMYVSFYLEN